ncbi:AAA family ATPase [Streptomyces coeruleorubidus]|uniref:AAA family ATPase n=1 Tax=Streptomyces coeruleorubidus TaxID=116188 RepID=UPI003695351E
MTGTPSGAHRRLSAATAAGREDTRLVVIRGNSASGKSSVAQGLRDHYGRGIAIVGQDVIRRNVLREHDTARGANITLLGRIARDALNAGFHVVLEGILYADRYSHMITSLVRAHRGVSSCYYLDVPLETTFVRHASKADAAYLVQVINNHLASWVPRTGSAARRSGDRDPGRQHAPGHHRPNPARNRPGLFLPHPATAVQAVTVRLDEPSGVDVRSAGRRDPRARVRGAARRRG